MSTQTTQGNVLQDVMAKATPQEMLRFARTVRSTYFKMVGGTEVVLDPVAVQRLDKCIAQLEGRLN